MGLIQKSRVSHFKLCLLKFVCLPTLLVSTISIYTAQCADWAVWWFFKICPSANNPEEFELLNLRIVHWSCVLSWHFCNLFMKPGIPEIQAAELWFYLYPILKGNLNLFWHCPKLHLLTCVCLAKIKKFYLKSKLFITVQTVNWLKIICCKF